MLILENLAVRVISITAIDFFRMCEPVMPLVASKRALVNYRLIYSQHEVEFACLNIITIKTESLTTCWYVRNTDKA